MTDSIVAKSATTLDDLREDAGRLSVPTAAKAQDIAFIGVFYNEGERLERLLRLVEPWFRDVIVVLQGGGTEYEKAIASKYSKHVMTDKLHGFCEPSFNPAIALAKDLENRWFFNLDGDELPDLTLLASLPYATQDGGVFSVGGARFPRRNTIELHSGKVIPVYTESMARLFKTTVTRPPIAHSDFRGTAARPVSWSEYGGIRHHRTLTEFVKDQVNYASKGEAYSAMVSADYLATMFSFLKAYLTENEFVEEMNYAYPYAEQATALISKFQNAEATWSE